MYAYDVYNNGRKMIRTQIYLDKDQKRALERLSTQEEISMAELIRRAVDEFLKRTKQGNFLNALERSFALWQDRTDFEESWDYVRKLRREWEGREMASYS